ncbi:MAG: hypothetical protein ACI8PG_003132, partial [Planctomycetota bacterium]
MCSLQFLHLERIPMLPFALYPRFILLFSIIITTHSDAQISVWKIGGDGLQWSQ